jgi:hypothetical protein
VVYGPIGLGGPFGLNFALTNSDPVIFAGAGITAGEHMLFAYQAHGGNVTIADVDFVNGVSGPLGTATPGTKLAISDIVDLPNGPGLIGIASHPDQIQFIHAG